MAIIRVPVFECPEAIDQRSTGSEVGHTGQDVNYRFCPEAWDGGASDMMDTPGQGLADKLLDELSLRVECAAPVGVVGDEFNRLVWNGSNGTRSVGMREE